MAYYIAFQSRSHAFLFERRMKCIGVECELTYMPRSIMSDLCNMGVKFQENMFSRAIGLIRNAGLPGCKLYKEIAGAKESSYEEIMI